MCGIVGYVGKREALPVLLDGLRRLEYRGYDSAGVAVLNGSLHVAKSPGKVRALEEKLSTETILGTLGIAHTRWATHGVPNEANAHPHVSCDGRLALVHNGIIENYAELRAELTAAGHAFASETDTETLAHLVEHLLRFPGASLADAVRSAVRRVRGTFGVAVVSADFPGTIVVARLGSPIVLGIGDGEMLVASDANAILGHTRQVVFLDDGEMAVIDADGYRVVSLDNLPVQKSPENLDWSAEVAQKNGFDHFMLTQQYAEACRFYERTHSLFWDQHKIRSASIIQKWARGLILSDHSEAAVDLIEEAAKLIAALPEPRGSKPAEELAPQFRRPAAAGHPQRVSIGDLLYDGACRSAPQEVGAVVVIAREHVGAEPCQRFIPRGLHERQSLRHDI
ncbi:hypothetical protein EBS80_03770, partial [bacterium]|nr:hypothetical protein [bacterium]